MKPFQTIYRISYSDTDQMGYMHHSNYLKYYENSRWELLRNMGIPYSEIEDKGFILPVVDMAVKFIKPAFYDKEIFIETSISNLQGARIIFDYLSRNEKGDILNQARITVACVRKNTGRACIPPKMIRDVIDEYYCEKKA